MVNFWKTNEDVVATNFASLRINTRNFCGEKKLRTLICLITLIEWIHFRFLRGTLLQLRRIQTKQTIPHRFQLLPNLFKPGRVGKIRRTDDIDAFDGAPMLNMLQIQLFAAGT